MNLLYFESWQSLENQLTFWDLALFLGSACAASILESSSARISVQGPGEDSQSEDSITFRVCWRSVAWGNWGKKYILKEIAKINTSTSKDLEKILIQNIRRSLHQREETWLRLRLLHTSWISSQLALQVLPVFEWTKEC